MKKEYLTPVLSVREMLLNDSLSTISDANPEYGPNDNPADMDWSE